ncbi:MAG: universal stress protein [Gemmatimonadota bacterium]|nr:universal stress protein [Gemmatimonadota bacterium]MDH5283387.1 universal stress protein [Gemmatimonadota bacterium]
MMNSAAPAARKGLRSLVVATDFTPGASRALRRAARLPLARGARVSLVHVSPSAFPAITRRKLYAETVRLLDQTRREFLTEAAEAGQPELRVATAVPRGRPFLEIIRHARKKKADLIVLGRHGRRRVGNLLAGSTAQRVARHSDVPVLLVNLEPRRAYRRMIFATDLEPGSRYAADLAARLMDHQAATVTVLHTYEVPFEGWIAVSDRSGGSAYRRHPFRENAMKGLRRFVAGLTDLGVPSLPRLRFGDPREVVIEEANRDRTELVALGSHARGGVARVVLGTVSETVMGQARCDVLVVRPPGLSVRMV